MTRGSTILTHGGSEASHCSGRWERAINMCKKTPKLWKCGEKVVPLQRLRTKDRITVYELLQH